MPELFSTNEYFNNILLCAVFEFIKEIKDIQWAKHMDSFLVHILIYFIFLWGEVWTIIYNCFGIFKILALDFSKKTLSSDFFFYFIAISRYKSYS